mmetsp:Transcript_72095/g.188954  ORF Transcript_72095/g.188954 Transcript_72095/m.188954 type:complete len:102 (+) Transcript_72095:437-742(+)
MLLYTVWTGLVRRKGLGRWGPLCLVTAGAVLAMLDPMRHLLLDHGGVFWAPEQLAMYTDAGSLSTVGHIFQVSTIMGVCCLFSGMLWYLEVPAKIMARVTA